MSENLIVPTMAQMMAEGKQPEILFWVGSAGSFDDRAKKISRAFVKILNKANVNFAVLGTEESCTGDIAKRAGNEFLFQMSLCCCSLSNAIDLLIPGLYPLIAKGQIIMKGTVIDFNESLKQLKELGIKIEEVKK